ncbi:hypothetical protein HK100_003772 [Physocladia obscura]|uniref:Uncharacterized protein n=1 Tax=Physocladia obscura TaxID=109957 RepID=A0AAD5XJP8_9FUNG|nr:hypothetical protein HK100_003772 [Physocladia obscura]
MEFRLNTLPTPLKLKTTAAVRAAREVLRIARKDLQKASSGGLADRAQLFSGSTTISINDRADSQRVRLLQGAETLQAGTERLTNIHRIANETGS